MKEYSEIYISVSGGAEAGKSISLTLPWDAGISDWVDSFKTILTHQTFTPETIDEVFAKNEGFFYLDENTDEIE